MIRESTIETNRPILFDEKATGSWTIIVEDSEIVSSNTDGIWAMNANSGGEPESKVKLILKERSLDPALTFGMEVCDHRASCDSDFTCAVCSQTIPKDNHEYETDTSILCKVHTCIHCGVPTTAVPCEYDSSKPLCVVSNCEYCGEPVTLQIILPTALHAKPLPVISAVPLLLLSLTTSPTPARMPSAKSVTRS